MPLWHFSTECIWYILILCIPYPLLSLHTRWSLFSFQLVLLLPPLWSGCWTLSQKWVCSPKFFCQYKQGLASPFLIYIPHALLRCCHQLFEVISFKNPAYKVMGFIISTNFLQTTSLSTAFSWPFLLVPCHPSSSCWLSCPLCSIFLFPPPLRPVFPLSCPLFQFHDLYHICMYMYMSIHTHTHKSHENQ